MCRFRPPVHRTLVDSAFLLRLLIGPPSQAADVSTKMGQVSSNGKQTSKAQARAAAMKLTIVVFMTGAAARDVKEENAEENNSTLDSVKKKHTS